MRITVYGTRGSYPVCRPSMMRYGGNTTCLHIQHGDEHLMVDGGSGAHALGQHLLARWPELRDLHLFMTHYHWDHVLGLPFFLPLYTPGYRVHVLGEDSETMSLQEVITHQHHQANFPIPFQALAATIDFRRLRPREDLMAGAFAVRTLQLNHPGVDLGYRFEAGGHAFVVLTDLAPITGNVLGAGMLEAAASQAQAEQQYQAALTDFIRGSDLVYHDTNFTDAEIVGKLHWGHSTPAHALQLLSHLHHPPALVLAHHDPNHADDTMDAIHAEARRHGQALGIDVLIAQEGGGFTL